MQKYKIGEVAKILGISTDLIRYYEEKGIVSPVKNPQNGYRYYDAWDINFLIDCVWYKNFGFSIDEIVKIESKSTYDSLLDRLDTMEASMARELHRRELLLERIRRQRESLENVRTLLDRCEVAEGPELVYYLNRHNFDYESDSAFHTLSRRWLKYMPFSKRYFEVEGSLVPGSMYSWGFSLEPKYVEEFGVEVKPPIKKRPGVRSIHSAFKSSGKNAFSPKHLEYMYKYAKKQGLTPCGSAYGTLVCSVLENNRLTGFFEAWLPIEADCPGTGENGG